MKKLAIWLALCLLVSVSCTTSSTIKTAPTASQTTTGIIYYDQYSGEEVELINNHNATNPTWTALQDFLLTDETDEAIYGAEYSCAGAAMRVHNNAEANGIKAGVVAIEFTENTGHMCNIFETTDKGRVYIDCTPSVGITSISPTEQAFLEEHPLGYDRVAYIKEGEEYGLIDITRAKSFSYVTYEIWKIKWNVYKEHPQAGYDDSLGPVFWNSPGIVKDINIVW